MVYSEHFEGEALDAMLDGCKECQKKLANLFRMRVIPRLGDMIQKLMDAGLPDENNPMLAGNSGQPALKEYDIVAELTPGTSFKHQMKNLIEVNRIIVKVKVWYEKVATQKVDPEHFIYDTYDGTGNGTLFSKSEFYIEDQKMILCVSRPRSSTDSQTILLSEEQNVAQSIPMAGVFLGNFPAKS